MEMRMPVLQMTALAAAGTALVATCVLLRATVGARESAGRLLFLWLLAYAQIVLLTEVLSELGLIGAVGYAVGHAILLAAAFVSWRRSGAPRLFSPPRDTVAAALLFVRSNKAVAVFVSAVGILVVLNVAFSFRYPVVNGDANAYHLPRAYYWTTLGTARHFPATDYRMNEMPPNPSFVLAWMLSLSGSFRGLHVPQWAAGLALSIAVAGLARLAGAGRAGALLAGSLTATLPVSLLQAGTAQTDLTAAATGAAALYFGLRAAGGNGKATRASPDAIGFSIAFGLALGTKLTTFFLLPGLAVAIVAVAWSRHGSDGPRRLSRLAAVALLGFALLGAYNYVLNVLDVGNLVASKEGFSLNRANRPAWCYEKAPNVLRYLHQTLDWPGIAYGPLRALPQMQERTFGATASLLGLSFEMGDGGRAIRDTRIVPDEEHSGFGPVGFAAFLLSPVVLVASAVSWAKRRHPEELARCLLVVTALGWFTGFVLSGQPWMAEVIRFFLMFIPLLVAAFVAQGSRARWGRAAGIVAACMSLVVATAVTFQGPGGIRRGAYRAPGFDARLSEEVIASLAETLPREFPEGARIGMVSEYNDVVFHLFRSVPRIRFVPVRETDVPDLLASGRIDGALVGQFRNESGQGWMIPGIPLPRNMLIVRDPRLFFRAHPRQYRFETGSREGRAAARIPLGLEKRWEGGAFHLRVPAELAGALGAPLELELTADRDLPSAGTMEVTCRGFRTGVRVRGRALLVEIPASCAGVDAALMDIVLARGAVAEPISFRGDAWVLGGPL